MKVKTLLIIIMVSVLSFSSCGKKISQEKQTVNEMTPENEIAYTKADFEISGIALKNPSKIVSDSDYLYICDTGNDRIIKCNYEGSDSLIIGELGSMDGEFSSPECIAVNKNKICVYDRENHRIQIFTKDGDFISKYEMREKFSSISNIIDIEIDNNDNIYFSVISYGKHLEESGIYVLTPENEVKSIKQLYVGNLCNNSESDVNDVIYVSKFELRNENEWGTGYSELGTISELCYNKKNAFSSMFSSIDIAEVDDNYLVYDDSTQSVYKFDALGNCNSCVFSEEIQNDFVYSGFCSAQNNCLYLSDKANNKIYILKPIE